MERVCRKLFTSNCDTLELVGFEVKMVCEILLLECDPGKSKEVVNCANEKFGAKAVEIGVKAVPGTVEVIVVFVGGRVVAGTIVVVGSGVVVSERVVV